MNEHYLKKQAELESVPHNQSTAKKTKGLIKLLLNGRCKETPVRNEEFVALLHVVAHPLVGSNLKSSLALLGKFMDLPIAME